MTDFERLLTRLALLMTGEHPARALLEQADALWFKLEEARLVERIWNAAREMIDERTARRWSRPKKLGVAPCLVCRGCPPKSWWGSSSATTPIPKRWMPCFTATLSSASASLWHARVVSAISGRVGDHGVTFLSADTGSAPRRRQRLLNLAERAGDLARRFGFRFHAGTSSLPASTPLPRRYQAALEAAGAPSRKSCASSKGSIARGFPKLPLDEMRRQLGHLVEERPSELPARFNRYLEAVARRCAVPLGPARAHLESGLERITDGLRSAGALEQKTFADMLRDLERRSREARTITELFVTYRRTVADIGDAVQQPRPAHRDRSVRRAIAYIREHYSEPLSLGTACGASPGSPPTTFLLVQAAREGDVRALFESAAHRASQGAAATTELDIERIARLSGLGTRQYMARVFQRAVGSTPRECRESLRPKAVR